MSTKALDLGREQKAWLLLMTATAGFLNASCLLSFAMPSSHQTGNVSQLALALSRAEFGTAAKLGTLLLAFFTGALLSGLLIHDHHLNTKEHYSTVLLLNGLVLTTSAWFLPQSFLSLALAAACAGAQNALFIVYKGAIIRSTHLTGYLTDAAVELSAWLRHKPNHIWKTAFYLASVLVFLLAGLAAAILQNYSSLSLLFCSGILYLLLGFSGIFLQKLSLRS